MRAHRYLYVLLPLLLASAACGPTEPTSPDAQAALLATPTYEDLQQRDDVLANLEAAFNAMDLDGFIPLVDDGITYHFSQSDISGGNVGRPTMDAADLIRATASLFGHDLPTGIRRVAATLRATEESTWGLVEWVYLDGPPEPANSVVLTLMYPPGEFTWVQVPGPGNEMWYQKTVDYLLTVTTDNITYTTGVPLTAVFTVRYGQFTGEDIWRIVEWRDDI